eukprot:3580381-Pleurochrysis_carterae.AAC.5
MLCTFNTLRCYRGGNAVAARRPRRRYDIHEQDRGQDDADATHAPAVLIAELYNRSLTLGSFSLILAYLGSRADIAF